MLSILVCHSYYLRLDRKQRERCKPYPPLATLQVAAMLRKAGHDVSFFDAMLADGIDDYDRMLRHVQPQVVLLYEDTFNFLSKMCLAEMRSAACHMIGTAHSAGIKVIAAGPDVTDAPETYLKAGADVALIGEGLSSLLELMPRLDSPIGHPWRGAHRRAVRGRHPACRPGGQGERRAGAARRPIRRLCGVGSGRHRALPRHVAECTRLLQPQHGGLPRLLVPLHVVRQADLGQSLSAAQAPRTWRRRCCI